MELTNPVNDRATRKLLKRRRLTASGLEFAILVALYYADENYFWLDEYNLSPAHVGPLNNVGLVTSRPIRTDDGTDRTRVELTEDGGRELQLVKDAMERHPFAEYPDPAQIE